MRDGELVGCSERSSCFTLEGLMLNPELSLGRELRSRPSYNALNDFHPRYTTKQGEVRFVECDTVLDSLGFFINIWRVRQNKIKSSGEPRKKVRRNYTVSTKNLSTGRKVFG
jgi:hypothetical protein